MIENFDVNFILALAGLLTGVSALILLFEARREFKILQKDYMDLEDHYNVLVDDMHKFAALYNAHLEFHKEGKNGRQSSARP